MNTADRELLSTSEAERLVGLAPCTLQTRRQRGCSEPVFIRLDHRYWYPREDLLAWRAGIRTRQATRGQGRKDRRITDRIERGAKVRAGEIVGRIIRIDALDALPPAEAAELREIDAVGVVTLRESRSRMTPRFWRAAVTATSELVLLRAGWEKGSTARPEYWRRRAIGAA